jgi:GR25 family glycosyltransferase involved in LPS biosynthesis
MVTENLDFLCVLEDDAELTESITNVEVPEDFDIVYLTERMQSDSDLRAVKGAGTEGYIISRPGVQKLLLIAKGPTLIPFDWVIASHIKNFCNTGSPHFISDLTQYRSRKHPDVFLNGYCSKKIYVKHGEGKSYIEI